MLLPGHSLETASSIAERLRKSTVSATPKDLVSAGSPPASESHRPSRENDGRTPEACRQGALPAKSNGRDRVEVERIDPRSSWGGPPT